MARYVKAVDAADVRAGRDVPRRIVAIGHGRFIHQDGIRRLVSTCGVTRREDFAGAGGLVVELEAVERIARHAPELIGKRLVGRRVDGLLRLAERHALGSLGVVKIVGSRVQADGVPDGGAVALGNGEGEVGCQRAIYIILCGTGLHHAAGLLCLDVRRQAERHLRKGVAHKKLIIRTAFYLLPVVLQDVAHLGRCRQAAHGIKLHLHGLVSSVVLPPAEVRIAARLVDIPIGSLALVLIVGHRDVPLAGIIAFAHGDLQVGRLRPAEILVVPGICGDICIVVHAHQRERAVIVIGQLPNVGRFERAVGVGLLVLVHTETAVGSVIQVVIDKATERSVVGRRLDDVIAVGQILDGSHRRRGSRLRRHGWNAHHKCGRQQQAAGNSSFPHNDC